MIFEPTKAQKDAVEITNQSIVLSAGAGSGKTRVLVQRYLHLLKKRLAQVGEILAITFTKKAAAEMKERISREVFELLAQTTTPEEKGFWLKVKEELNRAQITTFHGFCSLLLRSHPIEAEIDPYFRVLDEEEADDLLDEIIENLLLSGLNSEESNLVTLVWEFGLFGINNLLKTTYLHSRDGHLTIDDVAELTQKKLAVSEEKVEDLKTEIVGLIEEMLEINHNTNLSSGTKAKLDLLEGKWDEFALKIKKITSLADTERQILGEIRGILSGNLAKGIREQNTRFKEITDQNELDQYLADLQAVKIIPALTNVLKQIDDAYTRAKVDLGVLDFGDLEQKTIRMLQTNQEFCLEVGQRYKFIMVDEFQDTNPLQEELIRLLIGGRIDAPISGNKLFIVGDPKQSIYRFRGADVTVFKKVLAEIKAVGQEIQLNKNFRSRRKIIDFVNHFFTEVFGSQDNPYDLEYQESEFYRQENQEEVCVEFMLLDNAELKNEGLNARVEEAQQLAEKIVEMVHGQKKLTSEENLNQLPKAATIHFGDICILFQALSNIQIYEEALQRLQIPYTVINGHGFYERQEIRDLINLLRVVDNPDLMLQWVGVLRSPFCSLSDDEIYQIITAGGDILDIISNPEQIQGLTQRSLTSLRRFAIIYHQARKNRDKEEISTLISRLLEETGYLKLTLAHSSGELIRANLQKLQALARKYEQDTYSSLIGFIHYVERLDEKEVREGLAQLPGQHDLVKLMSIHQSKGLEFPVVIIPDTQRQLINHTTFPNICFDPQIGVGLKVRDPLSGGLVKTSIYTQLWEEDKKREIAERKRLFYVAATRARDHLVISGVTKKFKASVIDEGKNWLEWLGMIFNFQETEGLPETFSYGPENQHRIGIHLRKEGWSNSQLIPDRQAIDLEHWQQIYQNFDQLNIKTGLKRGFHSFGVSALMTYDRCPRWYYHQYIQQLPTNIDSPERNLQLLDVEDLLTMEMNMADQASYTGIGNGLLAADQRGTLIHFICQHLKTFDELGELIEMGLNQLGLDYLIFQKNKEDIETEIRPYIRAFVAKEKEFALNHNLNQLTEQREFPFNLVLSELLISGVMDRVLWDSRVAIIIDYKSNRVTSEKIQEVAEKYRLQAEIYALAIHKLAHVSSVQFKFHFLIPNQYWVMEFTGDDFLQIETKIVNLSGEIIASVMKGFPEDMSEYFRCSYRPDDCLYHQFCSYLTLCKENI